MARRRRLAVAAGTAMGTAALLTAGRAASHRLSPERDPEWTELHRPLGGEQHSVRSHDGTLLHAEVLGPSGAPTIVLAHGYVMSLAAWHYQRRDLADEFRVVAYDQRGHGRSQPAASGDYSIEALGRDLAAVIEALVPPGERCVVAGHSMGGMSVLAMAEHEHDVLRRRLGGAVLLDTTAADVIRGSAFSRGSAVAAGVLGTLTAAAVGIRPPASVELYRSGPALVAARVIGLSRRAHPAHVAFTLELALACPRSVSAAVLPTLSALDVRHAARRLDVPTLVVVGESDRLTPADASRELAAVLPDARLVVLPGIGHMSLLEAHREVTAHLRLFSRQALRREAA